MVGSPTSGNVDTRRSVTLRPWPAWLFLLSGGLVVTSPLPVLFSASPRNIGLAVFLEAWGLLALACDVVIWFSLRVRVRPSGVVVPRRTFWPTFSSRLVRWDEIDNVRLDLVRRFGRLTYYGPVLELRSGEELAVRALTVLVRRRRLARSGPARHVSVIRRYLDEYRGIR